jgi:hypothetical protein
MWLLELKILKAIVRSCKKEFALTGIFGKHGADFKRY